MFVWPLCQLVAVDPIIGNAAFKECVPIFFPKRCYISTLADLHCSIFTLTYSTTAIANNKQC